MTEESTVRSVTYDLLRSLGLTTVFGNPGSTEQTFLKDFPADFTYVLALQEASAMAMADAYAQVTRHPALVNLHSSAGVGNSLGNLVAAYHGNTPLIVTSGQQHRELVIGDCYLANREATTFPKPWVKWAYEPARAEDVPEAFMRAYVTALQPPAGPVYLSGSSVAGAGRPLPADRGLSLTELRVLRYLPTNLSRTEIAGELRVSVNTVNTHVRNIYAKLQATGRSTAVQRAREHRLLAGGPTAR